MNNLFSLCIFIIVVTFCLYLIVDRICRCIEQSNVAKSYNATVSSQTIITDKEE